MRKIISIDAETNGLWGPAFAISAVVKTYSSENDAAVEELCLRCEIEGEVNSFVKENVLPEMKDIPVNCENYKELLKKFSEFYLSHKDNAEVIVHMGCPVEAKLFWDMHDYGFIGDWDAPYPLIDICTFPEIGTSVDTYINIHKINERVPELKGGTHNPLYDSWAALIAYEDYLKLV